MVSTKCQCGTRTSSSSIDEDLSCNMTDDTTKLVAQLQDEKLQQSRHIAELRERIGHQSITSKYDIRKKLATVIAELPRGGRSSSSTSSCRPPPATRVRHIGISTEDLYTSETTTTMLTPRTNSEKNEKNNALEVFRMDYSPGSNVSCSPLSKRKLSLGAIYEDENWCDIGRRISKEFASTTTSNVSSNDLLTEESLFPSKVQQLVGSYDTHVGVPGILFHPVKSSSGYVLSGKWGLSDIMVGIEPDSMESLGCVFTNSGRIVTGSVDVKDNCIKIVWQCNQTWTRLKE
ncbi:hypothetical protein FOL47_005783 [Perkinsus chesapeaki]|uniref:Uncharacterized protein n=1 Tax=Perkinsus chesapeaki TaxID=330153 RepID=A0A7J6MZJ7_PERCH|nr:hypothetical protein FOL47_005783 [Perkinsus chesapeaki]